MIPCTMHPTMYLPSATRMQRLWCCHCVECKHRATSSRLSRGPMITASARRAAKRVTGGMPTPERYQRSHTHIHVCNNDNNNNNNNNTHIYIYIYTYTHIQYMHINMCVYLQPDDGALGGRAAGRRVSRSHDPSGSPPGALAHWRIAALLHSCIGALAH